MPHSRILHNNTQPLLAFLSTSPGVFALCKLLPNRGEALVAGGELSPEEARRAIFDGLRAHGFYLDNPELTHDHRSGYVLDIKFINLNYFNLKNTKDRRIKERNGNTGNPYRYENTGGIYPELDDAAGSRAEADEDKSPCGEFGALMARLFAMPGRQPPQGCGPVPRGSALPRQAERAAQPAQAFYEARSGRRLTGRRLASFERVFAAFGCSHNRADSADAWLDFMPGQLCQSLVDKIARGAARECEARKNWERVGRNPRGFRKFLADRGWEDYPEEPAPAGPTMADAIPRIPTEQEHQNALATLRRLQAEVRARGGFGMPEAEEKHPGQASAQELRQDPPREPDQKFRQEFRQEPKPEPEPTGQAGAAAAAESMPAPARETDGQGGDGAGHAAGLRRTRPPAAPGDRADAAGAGDAALFLDIARMLDALWQERDGDAQGPTFGTGPP